MKRLRIVIVGFVSLVLLAGCSAGGDEGGSGESADGGVVGEVDEAASGSAEGREDQAVSAASLPGLGPRVIQTATLGIVVERGSFDDSVREARRIASRLGGFVVNSQLERRDEDTPREGVLVLRVPESAYASAMDALTRLGRIEHESEEGQDVSQEFVDLEARKRHLEAVEAQLLELLERARTVQAALAVQAQLNSTQLELEQVRGRLRFLEDQTAFATITLELREPAEEQAAGGWGIVDAWKAGAHAFLTVARWAFVLVGALAPLLALAGLAFLGARLVRRRRAAASAG